MIVAALASFTVGVVVGYAWGLLRRPRRRKLTLDETEALRRLARKARR